MKITIILTAFIWAMAAGMLYSQHDHKTMDHSTMDTNMVVDSTVSADSTETDHKHQHDMNEHKGMDEHSNHTDMQHETGPGIPMTHLYSLSLPMNRNGSGTGWLPDESPMNGYMLHTGRWMLMFHGSVFLRYTSTD
ncbi:MAG: hypothetical protein JNK43_07610, partial [Ignavibacteria bacterium]|nr:hypothetical protein [Ignavibacteria bacterium]